MKPAIAGGILLVLWIIGMLVLGGDTTPNVINQDRNQALEDPCDFMSSGQYSGNC